MNLKSFFQKSYPNKIVLPSGCKHNLKSIHCRLFRDLEWLVYLRRTVLVRRQIIGRRIALSAALLVALTPGMVTNKYIANSTFSHWRQVQTVFAKGVFFLIVISYLSASCKVVIMDEQIYWTNSSKSSPDKLPSLTRCQNSNNFSCCLRSAVPNSADTPVHSKILINFCNRCTQHNCRRSRSTHKQDEGQILEFDWSSHPRNFSTLSFCTLGTTGEGNFKKCD